MSDHCEILQVIRPNRYLDLGNGSQKLGNHCSRSCLVVFMKCHNTWTLPRGYICHSVTIGKGLHHIQTVTTDWLIMPHLANFEDFAYYDITEHGIITRLFGRLGVTRHHKTNI